MNREQALELLNKYGRIASNDPFQPTLEELKALWSVAGGEIHTGWQPSIYFLTLKGKEVTGGRTALWNRFYDRQHVLLPLQ
jgi:hypothetical protein